MKRFIACSLVAFALYACSTKQETATSTENPKSTGYTLDSSANIDLVKKSITALGNLDSTTYRATYAENAVFHDNLDSMTLDQNVGAVMMFKKAGINVHLDSIDVIWETINKVPTKEGITNYVVSYSTFTFSKGDKKQKVIINAVDAIKDGKQVEEWLAYDKTRMMELFK